MSGQTVGHYFIEIPEQVGVDVCQFWPETGVNRDRRLRSPMQEQKRRGWQRLTP